MAGGRGDFLFAVSKTLIGAVAMVGGFMMTSGLPPVYTGPSMKCFDIYWKFKECEILGDIKLHDDYVKKLKSDCDAVWDGSSFPEYDRHAKRILEPVEESSKEYYAILKSIKKDM